LLNRIYIYFVKEKTMKKIALVLVVLLAISSIACRPREQRQADAGRARITLLMRNTNEQFLADYAANVRRLAAQRNVDINVLDANNDMQLQLSQLQTALAQGHRHFVIIPIDPALSDQFNQLIHAAGGAAAYSNTPPTTSSLRIGPNFFYASSPEFIAGSFQGGMIADYFDRYPDRAPGRVVNMLLINGQMGHPAQVNRRIGLMAELQNRGYTVNVVAEGSSETWGPDRAQELMTSWIAAFRNRFNVVAAQNDGMALGAVQALIMAGMTKTDTSDGTRLEVPVLGIDATGDAIASMDRYELYATVLQDAIGQSTTAFDVIHQVATGTFRLGNAAGGIPAATQTIDEFPANDSAVIRQCYLVPFVPVDRNSDFFRNFPR
jgi:ABC-type sugar transport system substrate-binding protein